MARRGVQLGTEYRTYFEDAFEHTDERLLVKLRTLCQIGRAAKVVDWKDVGSAFGGGRHELRRVDFNEALPVEGGPAPATAAALRRKIAR